MEGFSRRIVLVQFRNWVRTKFIKWPLGLGRPHLHSALECGIHSDSNPFTKLGHGCKIRVLEELPHEVKEAKIDDEPGSPLCFGSHQACLRKDVTPFKLEQTKFGSSKRVLIHASPQDLCDQVAPIIFRSCERPAIQPAVNCGCECRPTTG